MFNSGLSFARARHHAVWKTARTWLAGLTFTCTSVRYVTDYLGVLQTVPAGIAALEGGRWDAVAEVWHSLDINGFKCHSFDGYGLPHYYTTRIDSTLYLLGAQVRSGQFALTATSAIGTTHTSPPTIVAGDLGTEIVDGTVTWSVDSWYQDNFGWLGEDIGKNIFLNTEVPVTQDITTTARDYTIMVLGSGDITLTGTATGVATEGNPLTVTATAGTLTCTVNGTITKANVQESSFATSWILSTAVPVTRAASVSQWPSVGVLRGNDIALQGIVIPEGTGQTGKYLFSANAGTHLQSISTGLRFTKAGVSVDSVLADTADLPYQWQVYISTTAGFGIRVRHNVNGIWTNWTKWVKNSNTDDIVIDSVYELGSLAGLSQFEGNYPIFAAKFTHDPEGYCATVDGWGAAVWIFRAGVQMVVDGRKIYIEV